MRIAFVVSSFPELSETFILRQVTGLIDRGHDVTIFAARPASGGPAHGDVDAYDLRRRVRDLSAAGATAPLPALPALARAALRVRPRDARSLGGGRRLARAVAVLAADAPFDVVHCHYGEIGLQYRVAARVLRAPLVTSFYGYDSSSYPRAHPPGVYAPLFRDSAAVTSLSPHMDARLRALGCPADRLHRVPLPVDPTAFRPARRDLPRPGAEVRALTVARLTEKKGIADALRALALVADGFPELRYDVIGDGPLRAELEALAGALGVRAAVRFLGARADGDVRHAFERAHLFLLPSVTAADGDEEGTPTVLVEAALCELPVLATRHAGIPELVQEGESGYLVPERDPEALARALRDLLGAPERWAAMGRAGRRHVERVHATGVVAERLERLYEAVRAAR